MSELFQKQEENSFILAYDCQAMPLVVIPAVQVEQKESEEHDEADRGVSMKGKAGVPLLHDLYDAFRSAYSFFPAGYPIVLST